MVLEVALCRGSQPLQYSKLKFLFGVRRSGAIGLLHVILSRRFHLLAIRGGMCGLNCRLS
jgi:hypothetical protein